MQRAAAANAAKESSQSPAAEDSRTPTPKRPRVSTGGLSPSPSTPGSSELEAISAAIAAEEDKRREAVARQAAEAGETEWVLDFSGTTAETTGQYPPQPFVVAAGSLDDDDETLYGGRKSYGNFKSKRKVCNALFPSCVYLCLPCLLTCIL